jgi:hypothetical protein
MPRMKSTFFFKTLLTSSKITQHHNLEDDNQHQHYENLKFQILSHIPNAYIIHKKYAMFFSDKREKLLRN